MKNHYEVCGDTTVIYLRTRTNTCEAIIDTCDLERVMEYPNTWFYCIDGHGHKSVLGSATINGIKENYSLHRWISVSYTHLRAHETRHDLVCRLLLEKKKKNNTTYKHKNKYKN